MNGRGPGCLSLEEPPRQESQVSADRTAVAPTPLVKVGVDAAFGGGDVLVELVEQRFEGVSSANAGICLADNVDDLRVQLEYGEQPYPGAAVGDGVRERTDVSYRYRPEAGLGVDILVPVPSLSRVHCFFFGWCDVKSVYFKYTRKDGTRSKV